MPRLGSRVRPPSPALKSTSVDFSLNNVFYFFTAAWPSGLRRGSAKPLFVGSNPTAASFFKFQITNFKFQIRHCETSRRVETEAKQSGKTQSLRANVGSVAISGVFSLGFSYWRLLRRYASRNDEGKNKRTVIAKPTCRLKHSPIYLAIVFLSWRLLRDFVPRNDASNSFTNFELKRFLPSLRF